MIKRVVSEKKKIEAIQMGISLDILGHSGEMLFFLSAIYQL